MACCILGAIIMSQLFALWQMRRRILLWSAGLVVTVGLFAWQIDQHWHHIQQFAWDARALMRGEDPAVAALSQPNVICSAEPNATTERALAGRRPPGISPAL